VTTTWKLASVTQDQLAHPLGVTCLDVGVRCMDGLASGGSGRSHGIHNCVSQHVEGHLPSMATPNFMLAGESIAPTGAGPKSAGDDNSMHTPILSSGNGSALGNG
jgi:hypothetical protein